MHGVHGWAAPRHARFTAAKSDTQVTQTGQVCAEGLKHAILRLWHNNPFSCTRHAHPLPMPIPRAPAAGVGSKPARTAGAGGRGGRVSGCGGPQLLMSKLDSKRWGWIFAASIAEGMGACKPQTPRLVCEQPLRPMSPGVSQAAGTCILQRTLPAHNNHSRKPAQTVK